MSGKSSTTVTLKTANGYASSLKARTHLYNDGVRIFLTLGKLGKAIGDNRRASSPA